MVFLIKEKWHAESIFLLFLITGMVTSYVDLLTYPLITLGLPMMVFLLRWQENDGTWRKKLLYFMGNSMFWGIGYALMWGSKWILNSIFTNGNIFENVRTEIEIRLSNTGEAQETFTAGMVLQRNWDVINQFPFRLVLVVFAVYVVLRCIVHVRQGRQTIKRLEKSIAASYGIRYRGWGFLSYRLPGLLLWGIILGCITGLHTESCL